jgi:hypothetical protein
MKKLTNNEQFTMKNHDLAIAYDGNLFISYLRVPGGWIYNSYDKEHKILGSVFVPLNNEFMTVNMEPSK